MNRRLNRIALAATLAVAGSFVLASSASATYHLTKIREISGEGGASPDTGYIELQMYAPGQNLVSGHNITIWDQDALLLGIAQPIQTLPLSGPNPPFSDNQRTILIGDTAVAGRDFTLDFSPYFNPAAGGSPPTQGAGAACFDTVDCVSWGNFTGAANLPDKTTPNGSVLPSTYSLRRKVSAGCPTLLEASDDTNNAQADFEPAPKGGRPNGVTPTEVPCPGSSGTGSSGAGGFTTCAGKLTTIVGTDGKDALSGTPAADVIAAGSGNDTIKGLAGNDTLCGGPGKDTELGGKGRDLLRGEAGKDTLKGGPGKDKLKGGPGKDKQIQ
jgi:hypothetical protein